MFDVLESGKALVIEDHPETLRVITQACEAMGFAVEAFSNGILGLERALQEEFLLLILDVGLPGVDGFEICRQVRKKTSRTLIVFVSSNADEHSKVTGLDTGADDYLQKPLSVRELGARIRRLLRRRYSDQEDVRESEPPSAQSDTDSGIVEFGDLRIDFDQRRVFRAGEQLVLTALEYNLLSYLVSNPGRAVSREELLEQVWGVASMKYGNSVNSHVSRLRAKIEKDQDNPEYIFTVRGFGYQFASREALDKIKRSN